MPPPPITHHSWVTHRLHWAALGSAARRHAASPILDVGCGTKPYRELFPAGANYVGIDLPRGADIPRLPDRVAAVAEAIDVEGSGLSLPFPDESFATVVCLQVLEHVPDPHGLVREVARVLRPDGVLILMAPQMWHTHEAPHDYFRYTRFGLAHLVDQAGLTPISIRALGGFPARIGLKIARQLARAEKLAPPRAVAAAMVALNLAFACLDTLFGGGDDPINHLVVARKECLERGAA